MHKGVIYVYPGRYVGQVQSADLKRLTQRHKQHLRKHPDWNFPWRSPWVIALVTGTTREDLLFNLAWQETVLMFWRHTYWRVWPEGFNKIVPWSQDYTIPGKIGGHVTHDAEHRAVPSYHKQKVDAGRIGGRIGNREGKARSGRRYFELYGSPATPQGRRKGGRIGGRKRSEAKTRAVDINGRIGRRTANHIRWHARRGIVSPACALCAAQKNALS